MHATNDQQNQPQPAPQRVLVRRVELQLGDFVFVVGPDGLVMQNREGEAMPVKPAEINTWLAIFWRERF